MTRKEAEAELALFSQKPVVWFRSPYSATALGPTVLRHRGVPPTRKRLATLPGGALHRGGELRDPRSHARVLEALARVLRNTLTEWPRPQVEVTEGLAAELKHHIGADAAMAKLPEVRHQLNSHVDSSIGVLNTLFLDPTVMLSDGTLGYVFGGAIVAVNEPDFFRFDNEGRVHGETGPALSWRDGYNVFAWHGTLIPEAWIREKDKIDVEVALTWPNVEERRAAAEIMGWKKVLTKVNATVVDKHKDPEVGTLWHAELPRDAGAQPASRWMEEVRPEDAVRFRTPARTEPCRFIEVKCGTGRTFVIPVPPTIQTAMAAQEWMWGLGPGEYKPEART